MFDRGPQRAASDRAQLASTAARCAAVAASLGNTIRDRLSPFLFLAVEAGVA
jgi:hypothetical protein